MHFPSPIRPIPRRSTARIGNQNVNSLRSVIGLDISRPVSVPFGVLTPLIRAEWDHEFETGGARLTRTTASIRPQPPPA